MNTPMHKIKIALDEVGIKSEIIEYSDGYELEIPLDDVNLWVSINKEEKCFTIDFDEKGILKK